MTTGILSAISALFGITILSNGIILFFNNVQTAGTYLTILLGIVLILIAVFMKVIKRLFIYPLFKLIWSAICLMCILAVISSSFLFIYGRLDTTSYDEDYLVVLGCGINGTEPSEMLIRRLDKAVEYANRNTDCTIIVTGGMGKNEDIPESTAMKTYLTEKGISPDRIIEESSSTSTTENFKYANNITNGDLQRKSSVFITNNFHIYRANALAKIQGLSVKHLSASTPWHSIIPSYLRENLALIQMIVFNK